MDWLNSLVRTTSNRKSPTRKRASRKKRKSKRSFKKNDTKYFVRKSDNKVLQAHKRKTGYSYRKRTKSGTRTVPVKGTTYKTKRQARSAAKSNKH